MPSSHSSSIATSFSSSPRVFISSTPFFCGSNTRTVPSSQPMFLPPYYQRAVRGDRLITNGRYTFCVDLSNEGRSFVETALLLTGGTTFASPNEGRSFASPNFNAGRSFASPNFNAGRSFASRPFKVGTLFCRLMTKAELLQVCRVSRRRMRGVISRHRIRNVVSRRRISMRDVVSRRRISMRGVVLL